MSASRNRRHRVSRRAQRNRRWFIYVAPETMDEKSLNLWRQIEGARRVGKRMAVVRPRPAPGAGGIGAGG